MNINVAELVESVFGRYRHQYITNQVQYLADFAAHEISQVRLSITFQPTPL